jgi:hypothetical protein
LARRHWRFIVRDRFGYVIQNARVFVYQPGTSTDFTGAAYDAATGGSVVTNPFISNAQGEVEAWFVNAQNVDVAVDDNGDTAYRSVDGPGQINSFTSFTERDEILPDYSDINLTVPGVAGNLVAAIVNPFTAVTAVAGASGKYADAAHAHPYTALVPSAPGVLKSVAGVGVGLDPAREDHIHPFASALGKLAKFTTVSDTNEQLIHFKTIPANDVAAGSMFKISFKGFHTNSTTAITFTFRVRWGGLAGTQLFSIAFVGTTTAHTDNPVNLEFLLTVQTLGATGTIACSVSGDETITTAVANTPKLVLGVQAAAVTIDTTADKDLALTVQMSATTGVPNVEVDNVLIEQVA